MQASCPGCIRTTIRVVSISSTFRVLGFPHIPASCPWTCEAIFLIIEPAPMNLCRIFVRHLSLLPFPVFITGSLVGYECSTSFILFEHKTYINKESFACFALTLGRTLTSLNNWSANTGAVDEWARAFRRSCVLWSCSSFARHFSRIALSSLQEDSAKHAQG